MKKMHTVYQVSFFRRFFPVNCYLVEEQNELTLIDAALPFSIRKIIAAAKEIGKPITRIVLTHGHEDHVGALDSLRKLYPDIPVYISVRDARLLAGDRSLDPGEIDKPIRGGVPKSLKTRAGILLKDGDEIGSLIAVSTPGHTPGSMSFFDQRNKAVIAGDAFQTKGGVAVSGVLKPLFPFPALATWDTDTAIKSAEKILSLQPSLLAAGHGDMLINPAEAMLQAIDQAKQKTRNQENV